MNNQTLWVSHRDRTDQRTVNPSWDDYKQLLADRQSSTHITAMIECACELGIRAGRLGDDVDLSKNGFLFAVAAHGWSRVASMASNVDMSYAFDRARLYTSNCYKLMAGRLPPKDQCATFWNNYVSLYRLIGNQDIVWGVILYASAADSYLKLIRWATSHERKDPNFNEGCNRALKYEVTFRELPQCVANLANKIVIKDLALRAAGALGAIIDNIDPQGVCDD